MGLNAVPSLSFVNKFVSFANDKIKPIDISVTDGEFLTPEQLTQKIVMKALNTTDSTKADEFIKQSGFKLEDKDFSRKSENGNFFYRFEPTEKFQASIDNFQNKGQALPLQEFKVDVLVSDLKPIAPKNNGQINKKIRPQPKQANDKINNAGLPPSTVKIYQQTVPQTKSNYKIINLDPKEFAKIDDPRREILEKALQTHYQGRYSPETIKLYLDSKGKNDDNSVFQWNRDATGNDIVSSASDVKASLAKAVANKQPYEFGLLKSNPTLEESLSRTQIENFGTDKEKLQLKLRDEIRAVNDKFKDIPIDNNLQKAFLELNRQNQIKDAIDKVYAESGIDFRSNQTEAQQGANETANTIEKAIRFGLDTNPNTSWMPQALKDRIVNFGIGIANGTTYLASASDGVNSFFRDKAVDAVSYGLNKLGYDTTKFDNAQTEYKQKRAEMWQAYTNLQTSNLSRLDTALEEKIKKNLPLGGMDIPSLERSVGSTLPQAVVQGAIAVGTGGASIPAQIAITAGVNGGMTFGATYSQTNNGWKAGEEAIWTAGQTAMIPISSKLPGAANTAFDLATGYVVGKMRGQSDIDILDSMLTQGILGAGFKVGSKFAELSPAMKQKAVDTFKTVAKESQKAVDGIYNKAKAKFNLAEAETNYKQAKIELTKQKVGVISTVVSAGGAGSNISPVKVSKALLDVGKYHLLNGANNFKDFSAKVLADAGDKAKGKLLSMYEKLIGKEKANADKTYQAAKTAKNWNEIETKYLGKDAKDGIPDGYFVRGEELVRKTGNPDEFVKLRIEDGKIALADAKTNNRISDSYQMTKNYDADLEARWTKKLEAKGLTGEALKLQVNKITDEIKGLINRHHMLADNVIQSSDLGKRALQAGYKPKLDDVNNLIGMPINEAAKQRLIQLGEITPNTPQHRGPHPLFDKKVTDILNKAQKKLESDFGKPIDQIPDKIILEKMKEVEKQVREMIKKGDVETKNDKLSFYELPQRRLEIRV